MKKDGRMGYINRSGDLVIPCQYDFAFNYSHGYALVQDNEGFFFIDKAGTVAFPDIPRAIIASPFNDDGTAYLGFADHSGIFIDEKGMTVCSISAQYRFRSGFSEGLAGIAGQNDLGE